MTRIAASAPGKLVLLGEYAVLDGAPALVQAVDRRARVALTRVAGDAWQIVSPTLGLEASLRVRDSGAAWDTTAPPQLDWLTTLFAHLPFSNRLPACRVELDSGCFHIDHGGARVKLGLGSSAALTVALLGALHALAGQAAPTLAECVRTHRAIQHGRGSGIDIAASLHGGLLRFRLDADRTPRCEARAWLAHVHWCCVFSGKPASTEAMLATVAAWRDRNPAGYTRRVNELATISSRGIDAVARHDAAALFSCIHEYGLALARFGEASGADIASHVHRELGAIASECGVVYKSCGAGGGDMGITLAVEDVRLRDFATRATQAGFLVTELAADPRGLHVDVND